MLAQRVNFLKVFGAIVFVAWWSMLRRSRLCAKAKNRHLSEGCSGPLRHTNLQVYRAGELEPFEMVYQRHFDSIRRQDDRRCSYFKLYMKLWLCCRITVGVISAELKRQRSYTTGQSEEKTKKIVTKNRKQDHTEVSFRDHFTVISFHAQIVPITIGRAFHRIVSSFQKKVSSFHICYIYFLNV